MKYKLIGAACCYGAQIKSCDRGPHILKEQKLLERLKTQGVDIDPAWNILVPEKQSHSADSDLSESISIIKSFNKQLAKVLEKTLMGNQFPVVFGGDHSIAVGTWNGAYQYFQKKNLLPFGLIWIDAHLDAHTDETTPSGAWHGMPVAGLLGYGHEAMAKLLQDNPVLSPKNICFIGPRSYEKKEHDLITSLNIRVFYPDEIKKKGLHQVMQEAIQHVCRHTKCFGVSLDIDVITPEEAPGVGSPEKNGLHTADLLNTLTLLKEHPQLKVFEVVEYNPSRNHHHQTAELCYKILNALMGEP